MRSRVCLLPFDITCHQALAGTVLPSFLAINFSVTSRPLVAKVIDRNLRSYKDERCRCPLQATPTMPTTTIEPTMISNASCATETKRPHPSPPSRHKLARPFVLPQQAYNPDSPFVRGYSPMLPVTETAFISFIDRLNVAMLKKPEDQVVALATSASMVLCVQTRRANRLA